MKSREREVERGGRGGLREELKKGEIEAERGRERDRERDGEEKRERDEVNEEKCQRKNLEVSMVAISTIERTLCVPVCLNS